MAESDTKAEAPKTETATPAAATEEKAPARTTTRSGARRPTARATRTRAAARTTTEARTPAQQSIDAATEFENSIIERNAERAKRRNAGESMAEITADETTKAANRGR